MNPVYAHVLIVHLPVVGTLFTFAVLVFAAAVGDRRTVLFGCALAVVCAAAAAAAYGTGPPAYEVVGAAVDEPTRALAEQHAVMGRVAFVLGIVAGIIALQALLRAAAAEDPSPWVVRALAALLLLLAGILSWTAHLGGGIAHPEARSGPTSSADA